MSGAIHDLGYKRYLGTRRPQSTRWRVIVRNQLGTAWKTWWRMKMPLAFAVIAMFGWGVAMYVKHYFAGGGRWSIVSLDVMLAMATRWFCYAGFLVGLTVASGTIAADKQVGAFTFYFARPVRPIDYVLGKLGGLFAVQLIVIAAPLTLLALFRCGLVDSTDELVHALPALAGTIATGVLAAAVYAAVPLGLSSLVQRRRNAIAIWATYYMIVCNIIFVIGATGAHAIACVDMQTAVTSAGAHLVGADVPRIFMFTGPFVPALIALAVYIGGGIVLAWSQVASEAHAGVGG